jgi:hypothetical protein
MTFGLSRTQGLLGEFAYGVPYGKDIDALTFVATLGTLSFEEKMAVETLVMNLKTFQIWWKLRGIYPMVGGTAATHKFNLKDPRDLDAAYRLSFLGGWVHSRTGALPSAVNGYADSFINLNTMKSINDISYGYYNRTNSINLGSFGWGAPATSPVNEFYIRYGNNQRYAYLFDNVGNSIVMPDCRGLNVISRIASNIKYILQANVITTSGDVSSGSLTSKNFFFSRGSQAYEGREIAFGFVGDGLTLADMRNFNTIVQTFQIMLQRQI